MKIAPTVAIALATLFYTLPVRAAFDCIDRASDRLQTGEEEAADEAIKRGARNGDARCKFILGMWSLTGANAKRNPDQGLRWLKAAAKDGLPIAQSSLGLLYASGVGLKKNEQKAAKLYRNAAEKNRRGAG